MSIKNYSTKFISSPIFSIEQIILSPLFMYLGGLKDIQTPHGVPVAIMSPASKVIPFDISDTK